MAQPLKVFHALCSDRKGGLENAFVNAATALDALGHEVINLTPEAAPYLAQMPAHIKHKIFQPRGFYDVCAAWHLRQLIKHEKPDLLIAHNSRAVQILHWARMGLKVPLLGFSHGDKTARVKKADAVVVLTPTMQALYEKAGVAPERLFIFPNMFRNLPQETLAPPPSRAAGEAVCLGFVGRLAPEKGLEDLLEALALLKKRGIEATLAIAGSGKDDALIQARAEALGIADALVFSGWVDDIPTWLEGVDIVVLPTRLEAFGIVVLEAHAHGRVVVSTKTAGPASQIVDGETGFLAEPADPVSLAETLERALSQRGNWPSITARGFENAQHYSMAALLPRLEQIVSAVYALKK